MNCNTVHFIHTIIGGVVEKIPNISTFGTPPFRFKEIGAIYAPEGANNIKMYLTVDGRVTRRSHRKLDFNDGGLIGEAAGGCDQNWVDKKSSNDSDELSICEMTLKELKDRCRAKKRKVSKFIDCTEHDIDYCRKTGPACDQLKEEFSDLEETLSCWKQKLPKKPKVKRGHMGKNSCSPKSGGSVKDEQECSSFSNVAEDSMRVAMTHVPIRHELSQTEESCTLNKIKSEVLETDWCDHQYVACIGDCSIPACSVKVNSSDKSSAELFHRVGGDDMEIGKSISYIAKVDSGDSSAELLETIGIEFDNGESTFFASKSQDCCINKVSTQYLECGEPSDIPGVMPKMGFLETTSQGSLSPSTHELAMENALACPVSSGSAEALTVPKDLNYEIHGNCKNKSSPEEILYQMHYNAVTELPNLVIDNLWCTELDDGKCISDLESEGPEKLVDKMPMEYEKSMESNREDASDPADHSTSDTSDLYHPSQASKESCESRGSYSTLSEISCSMYDNTVTQMCNMDIGHSIQCTGVNNGNDGHTSDFESEGFGVLVEVSMDGTVPNKDNKVPAINKDDTYHENTTEKIDAPCTASQNSNLCFSVSDNFHSCDGSLPMSEETLSFSTTNETMPATVDEAGDSFTVIAASGPTDDLIETRVCALKSACPPEKLLSTRTFISPTSQEKLCRAAEDDELCNSIKLSKNRKNLCLERCTKNKALSEACFEEAEFMIKKPKNRKNVSPSVMNNTVKPPHASCVAPCACMQCTWINEHAQKAITFSQRQMHDIESLATRLMNGLKSMTDIVEDTLLSEECLSMPSKYTVDEIRGATKETTILEDSTRKWLTMMAKDCNRFCKIMTSTTSKAATKVSGIHKVQRKVTFADEVGGSLCHVKILEGHSTFSHGS